jgi:hypothetical protein
MGKVERLELWWQLYLYVTSGSGLRKKPAITLCAFECTFPSTKIEMQLVWKDSILHIWYVIYRWVPSLLSLYVPICFQAVHTTRFTHYINRLCSLTNYKRGGHIEKIKETIFKKKHFSILTIKPTRCNNFSNLFWNEALHVLDSSSVHHQEFFTVHTEIVYFNKPVWHIPLLCVQCKTPDDWQKKCPKHVEFHSKNKFEKSLHLIGFIIRICHYAWSY